VESMHWMVLHRPSELASKKSETPSSLFSITSLCSSLLSTLEKISSLFAHPYEKHRAAYPSFATKSAICYRLFRPSVHDARPDAFDDAPWHSSEDGHDVSCPTGSGRRFSRHDRAQRAKFVPPKGINERCGGFG
jgi:hypothetical protein